VAGETGRVSRRSRSEDSVLARGDPASLWPVRGSTHPSCLTATRAPRRRAVRASPARKRPAYGVPERLSRSYRIVVCDESPRSREPPRARQGRRPLRPHRARLP
jgi:hypothetical protein